MPKAKIITRFDMSMLDGDPAEKTALLINPPVYDTQYWARWSQPYGLLRIASLLAARGYKRRELYDFMETDAKGHVHHHRISAHEPYGEREEPTKPCTPWPLAKDGVTLDLWKCHFGRTWSQFDAWLDERGFTAANPPDEVYISAIMTYWWESVRDLTARLRRRFGKGITIIVGGIYPTLCPEHAAEWTDADVIVAGEVEEANNLWPDLSLYETPPHYAIVTPSRGCPYNCSYCAQRTINASRRKVEYRPADDIVAEIRHQHDTYGINEVAFYADFLLWDSEANLEQVLKALVADKTRSVRLHAPEGLDVRYLSKSQRLVDLMKEARFAKLYLPVENIDETYLRTMNRRHVRLRDFVEAVRLCEKAGFKLRNLEVNAFVLYGLPRETIDGVVKTILFVSEVLGSIIPMLFTPVPATGIYLDYAPFFRARGWDRDLHMLNGKVYPFLEINEGSIEDYIDLQRMMFMLNTHYRDSSFRPFGDSRVAEAFRDNLTPEFQHYVRTGAAGPGFTDLIEAE